MKALLLLVALGGCHKAVKVGLDPDLPADVSSAPELDAAGVLLQGAYSVDPSLRARALYWAVRTDPSAGGGGWGARGTLDPDLWVQRHAALGLVARGDEAGRVAALAYVGRPSVEPYAAAQVAAALGAQGVTDVPGVLISRARIAGEPWAAAPLWFAVAALGEKSAAAPLAKALSAGELALEPDFVRLLGAAQLPGLAEGLAAGAANVEQELAAEWAGAQLLQGDATGEATLRDALGQGGLDALEALDVIERLPNELALGLLRKAKGASEAVVSETAGLMLAARQGEGEALELGAVSERIEVRAAAVRASVILGQDAQSKRGLKLAQQLALAGMVDGAPVVRIEAVRALAALPEFEARLPALRAALRDDTLLVRIEAAGQLRLAGEGAAPDAKAPAPVVTAPVKAEAAAEAAQPAESAAEPAQR